MRRVISSSLSPNTEFDDVILAFRTLVTPWLWKKGEAVKRVEEWFRTYCETQTAVTFNSGRAAMLSLLKAFDIGDGDEVLVQAFTCVAVPNSVLWVGAKPVFVDIDDSFNIDPVDVEKKITSKTKAIVVQHTFGIPAKMDALSVLAEKHKLIVIEDCAHSLGATYKGKKIGTLGDSAFFSFGRDKVLSSVWGGAALINDKCQMTNAKWKLKEIQKKLPIPGNFWIFQQLLHPLAFSIILILYDVWFGKLLLVCLQKVGLLSIPVYPEEKNGGKPHGFPAKYPNALAILLLNQLRKLDQYNKQRQQVAHYYDQMSHANRFVPGAIYLRYPMLAQNPHRESQKGKKQGILLGNWYHNIIDPTGVDLARVGYKRGSCLKAEDSASHILNLPTRISSEEAKAVIAALAKK